MPNFWQKFNMTWDNLFWDTIAEGLEQKYGSRPNDWKKGDIESHFLLDLKTTVEEACLNDANKAELCGFKKESQIRLWEPTYDTFRRVFKSHETKGSSRTKNIYAIFLGFDSEDDFCRKKGISKVEQPSFSAIPSRSLSLPPALLPIFRKLIEGADLKSGLFPIIKKLFPSAEQNDEPQYGFDYYCLVPENPDVENVEIDFAFVLLDYKGTPLNAADIKHSLKKIQQIEELQNSIFSYKLILHGQLSQEEEKQLGVQLKATKAEKEIEFVEFFYLSEFLLHLTELLDSELRDIIIAKNNQYKDDYQERMESLFYLAEVPFSLGREPTSHQSNPLQFLNKKLITKDQREDDLLYILLKRESSAFQETEGDIHLVISEFGFGKTSLLLNIFGELSKAGGSAIFVPLAQLPPNSFKSEQAFVKGILTILYSSHKNNPDYGSNLFSFGLNFYDDTDPIAQLLIAGFSQMVNNRKDVIFLFDGLDENELAYSFQGITSIFHQIKTLKSQCIITMRREFWADRFEDIEYGFDLEKLDNQLEKHIFLSDWQNAQITQYLEQYLTLAKPTDTEKQRIHQFIKQVQTGAYETYYGDIPKRPLFLSMLTSDIKAGNIEKRSLAEIYERYFVEKFKLDLSRAFRENTEQKQIRLLEEEGMSKILKKMKSVLVQVAALMIINNEHDEAVLLPHTLESKVEIYVQSLKLKEFSITEVLLNSVLVPLEYRRDTEDIKIKFAHKSFQEYFTACYLFDLLHNPGGNQQDYDFFRYKFEDSVVNFLTDHITGIQTRFPQDFNPILEMLKRINNDNQAESSVVRRLLAHFHNK